MCADFGQGPVLSKTVGEHRFDRQFETEGDRQIPFSVAQPRILFGRAQSVTSSVTDVVLSSTVPSAYFLTVENWYKAPVKILTSLFRGNMASSASFWLRHRPFFSFMSVRIEISTWFSKPQQVAVFLIFGRFQVLPACFHCEICLFVNEQTLFTSPDLWINSIKIPGF